MTVDLAAAKIECRVVNTTHDTRITQYLNSAIAWVENYTHTKLTRGTVTEYFTAFADSLPILWGPDPDTLTITYSDADDAEQTIDDARIALGYVWPPLGAEWPSVAANSVIAVDYEAGFATTPDDLDLAVLLYVREMFDNGLITDAGDKALMSLCAPYRTPTVA